MHQQISSAQRHENCLFGKTKAVYVALLKESYFNQICQNNPSQSITFYTVNFHGPIFSLYGTNVVYLMLIYDVHNADTICFTCC